MERGKVSAVTGVTVAGRGLANGNADPGSGRSIMTAGTRVMDLGIACIDQRRRSAMTVSTLGTGYGHETGMIRRRGQMCGLPRSRMTGSAVAAGGKVLTNG